MPPMTSRNESREEVPASTPFVAASKQQVRVAAWNVRTMYKSSKRDNINILVVSEARWTDSGKILTSGETVCYSGRTDGQHQEGVAVIMDRFAAKCLRMGAIKLQDHKG